jgi:hypothetical protein
MDQHVKVLGILHIVYGAIGICSALVLFAFVLAGGLISGDSDALIATSLIATVGGFFLAVVFLPGVIGGVYLLRRRSWARILLIVVGALNLPGLPLGTALGIYTIWVLTRPEAVREMATAPGV